MFRTSLVDLVIVRSSLVLRALTLLVAMLMATVILILSLPLLAVAMIADKALDLMAALSHSRM